MKNVLFSLFAIGLAGLAAVAATTAFLNSPSRQASNQTNTLNIGPPAGQDKPAAPASSDTPPATSPTTPAPAPAGTPGAPDAGAAKPAPAAGAEEPESDADPYEGIPPEELPPDLQYDADSSVSFPTNI